MDFAQDFRAWKSLRFHGGGGTRKLGGFGRKLLFVLGQARDARADGLVATVDEDKGGRDCLGQLRRARTTDRLRTSEFPAALGQARPHAEAWLLDDPLAVREALGLPAEAGVPSVRDSRYPKHALHELWEHSPRKQADPGDREMEILPEIARRVAPSRCAHRRQTGFQAFVRDVRRELAGLAGD
jgi:hypothetical protein